jgi:hypothetical protein
LIGRPMGGNGATESISGARDAAASRRRQRLKAKSMSIKPPMTEEDEHLANIWELGVLSGRVKQLEGKWPRAIEDLPDYADLWSMTTSEIADLCAAIREEYPALTEF